MGALSPLHWLIAIGVLVLLFGAKRLPDAARSLGRSARILKSEIKDMNGNDHNDQTVDQTGGATAADRPATALPATPVAAQSNTAVTTPSTPTVGVTDTAVVVDHQVR